MQGNIHKARNPAQVLGTLYLGANIPLAETHSKITGERFARATVSDKDFANFLEHVTPGFPGFTVTEGQGYWKGQPELVRMLSIMAPDTDAFRATIRQFAEQYKTMFAQEAVAYCFTPCEFSLDCWPYGPVKTYHTAGKGY
jgi:hypothetical protein